VIEAAIRHPAVKAGRSAEMKGDEVVEGRPAQVRTPREARMNDGDTALTRRAPASDNRRRRTVTLRDANAFARERRMHGSHAASIYGASFSLQIG